MAKEFMERLIRIRDQCRHFLGEIQKDKVYLYCKRCKRLVLVHSHREFIDAYFSDVHPAEE